MLLMRSDRVIAAIGLILGVGVGGSTATAQYTANSLAELRSLAATHNGATITLSPSGGTAHPETGIVTPGEYWFSNDIFAGQVDYEPIYLELGGNNNTYVFDNTSLNLDTRDMAGHGRQLGHDSTVRPLYVTGSNNTIQGLSLIGQDLALDTDPNASRNADWGAQFVRFTGNNNSLIDAHVVTRGSSPYGYGDAFGKGNWGGQLPYIGHRKTAGILIWEAEDTYFNNVDVDINTYGHGIFLQKAKDTVVENSTITGELFSSQNVIDHELYQEYGHTWYGGPIYEDILISGAEDGFRAYGTIDGVSVENITARNVVITNMRTGFATSIARGDILLENVESYGAEANFAVGSNHTIINAKGDIANGLLFNGVGSNISNSTVDIELVGDVPVGRDWQVGYITGDNVDVTVTSNLPADAFPEASYVRLGQQDFQDWRFPDVTDPDNPDYDLINSSFANNTNQILHMGSEVEGNVGSSLAPVISNGKTNYYDGVTIVLPGTRTSVSSGKGLGNSGTEVGAEHSGNSIIYTGTATASTYDDNGTIVYDGATLEIEADVNIINERVTITGNGVDGKGAIYSDGSAGNGTRLVGDGDLIVLDGDASIGVGVAGNQLLVDRIVGTGNFTKLGPGQLTIGKKGNDFDGDFIVAEGYVEARDNAINTNLIVHAGASIAANGDYMLNAPNSVATIDGTLDLNTREEINVIPAQIGLLNGGATGLLTITNPNAESGGLLEIVGDTGEAAFLGQIDGFVSIIKSGSGVQSLGGSMSHTGSTTVDEGQLLVNGTHTGGDTYTVNDGGVLGGTGTIDAEVLVNAGGVLAPGASAGTLEVSDLTLAAGSTLALELGSSGSDLLSAGTADLSGDVSISLLEEGEGVYLPSSSASFEVVDAQQSLTGAFANASTSGDRVATTGGEGSFAVVYISSIRAVYLTDFHLAGDYNADGVVDTADYTVWREAEGSTGLVPYSGADGDGDGQVTQNDYAVWRDRYGTTLASAAAAVVPEPASILLALPLLAVGRRSKRAF